MVHSAKTEWERGERENYDCMSGAGWLITACALIGVRRGHGCSRWGHTDAAPLPSSPLQRDVCGNAVATIYHNFRRNWINAHDHSALGDSDDSDDAMMHKIWQHLGRARPCWYASVGDRRFRRADMHSPHAFYSADFNKHRKCDRIYDSAKAIRPNPIGTKYGAPVRNPTTTRPLQYFCNTLTVSYLTD